MRSFLSFAAVVVAAALIVEGASASDAMDQACSEADSILNPETGIAEELCACVSEKVDENGDASLEIAFVDAWSTPPEDRRSMYTMEMGQILAVCAQSM